MKSPSLWFMEFSKGYVEEYWKGIYDGLAHPDSMLQELMKLYADKMTRYS